MDALILDPLQEERVTVTGRVLNIPESLQTVGVKTDNKVERIYFELPRYFDGFNDFSEFNFYINYINANGDGDVYYCDDLEIEDDNVVFSWLTDNKLYATKGTAQFTVRAMHSDGRKWNTTIAQLTILDGLETQEAVVEQDYDFINQQFEIIREHTEKLNALIEQVKANTTNLDNAINTMGQAEWNGNQVRFTDGKGNYGQYHDVSGEFISRDEIYLGYSMSQDYPYSGHAGNYGIDVAKIVGAYVQDGTPTPDNPVEPQFNVINNFNTNGGNLFDASKLATKSQGGATVTNNGDGSFTISGSGNLSSVFSSFYEEENFSELIKSGNLNVSPILNLKIYFYIQLIKSDGSIIKQANSASTNTTTITDDDIANTAFIRFGFYGESGTAITSQTFKPMVWQYGDGTWYPFNASNTPVSLELRALPDGTADVWEDGNVTKNVAKVTFDGSIDEQWESYNIYGYNGYDIKVSNMRTGLRENFLCNIYKANGLNDDGVWFGVNSNFVYFPKAVADTGAQTLEEWRTYLSQHPITIYYALATPTTEPLAIPTLTSYYPFTNAWCDSELEPKLIEWHINNKINYIEKLINNE